MLAEVVIFVFLVSGSFYAAVGFDRKFEEILPLTIMTSVALTFFSGMMHELFMGAVCCFSICVVLYILAGIKLCRSKSFLTLKSNFFTPSFFLFLVLYIVLILLIYGKKATDVDEFSHWIECVRSMIILDDFSTNPLSHDDYRSYPPGMALFQYTIQKLYLIFNPNIRFCEWVVYFAYQVFAVSLIFPFLKKIQWKKAIIFSVVIVGIFLSPSVFYSYLFRTLTIDPFVAMLAGTGIAMTVLISDADTVSSVSIAMICVNLYLAKDVGILFSVFILLLYLIKINCVGNFKSKKKRIICNVLHIGIPAVALISYRLAWLYEIKATGARIVNVQKYMVREFFEYAVFRNGTDFRQTVVNNYKAALIDGNKAGISILGGVKLNYIVLSLIMIVLIVFDYLAAINLSKKNDDRKKGYKRFRKTVIIVLSLLLILYVTGIGIFFTSGTEYSAVRLMSFSRYMNIVFMSIWIYLVTDFIWILSDNAIWYKIKESCSSVNWKITWITIMSAVFIFTVCVNVTSIVQYCTRTSVRDSIEARKPYENLSNQILNSCSRDDKIYFVSRANQGENSGGHGLYYNIIKFNIEPFTVSVDKRNQWDGWSLGPPLSEDDIWYLDISADEWYQVLRDEGYTYVAIFRKGDDLYDHFGTLFENQEEIKDDALYKIDFSARCLRRVDVQYD